jgi:hypothetical protein
MGHRTNLEELPKTYNVRFAFLILARPPAHLTVK